MWYTAVQPRKKNTAALRATGRVAPAYGYVAAQLGRASGSF